MMTSDKVPVPAGFEILETGLAIIGDPAYPAWCQAMEQARAWHTALPWVIGALVNYGEDRFGEQASQIIDSAGWAEDTIRVYCWVERQVPPENRIPEPRLSFGHHQVVAALPPAGQQDWLHRAEVGDDGQRWSTQRLKRELAKRRVGGRADLWVTVSCTTASDQERFIQRCLQEGRRVKGV